MHSVAILARPQAGAPPPPFAPTQRRRCLSTVGRSGRRHDVQLGARPGGAASKRRRPTGAAQLDAGRAVQPGAGAPMRGGGKKEPRAGNGMGVGGAAG
eukprot:361868-Chlamydomonas_euryale.AAC.3